MLEIVDPIDVAVDLGTLFIEEVEVSELLKTGQTTKYHDGDDGDLELGIAHDYTILTTGQYSGTTNIVINGKTHALSNNCVRDNRTNKMWARYVPNADIGADNDGKLFWIDAANAEDIWSFVAQANANSLGGYNDWRIPNYYELSSILNIGQNNPCVDTTVFPSVLSVQHWTSSTRAGNVTRAYFVSLYFGAISSSVKTTGKYPVYLVRG